MIKRIISSASALFISVVIAVVAIGSSPTERHTAEPYDPSTLTVISVSDTQKEESEETSLSESLSKETDMESEEESVSKNDTESRDEPVSKESSAATEAVTEPVTAPPETTGAPVTTAAPVTTTPVTTAAPPVPPVVTPPEKPATAEEYVDSLPLEMQVAQLFFVRCPASDGAGLAKKYSMGGYILFARDFDNKTPSSMRSAVSSYQNASSVPMLIGVDEEGGSVVRISSHPAFRSEKFKSPAELYAAGGINAIVADAKEKDKLLLSLGINVNLAPVCDISTDPDDFIYKRTLGKDADITSQYISAVVSQMCSDRVGCALKHFPGYGNNVDTHTGIAIDDRPIETFRQKDLLPFKAGIGAGAGSVMVSHNIINAVDPLRPASLSPGVHELLRGELGFGGVIMTDDLSMGAITQYTNGQNAAVAAILAGNDMIISSDFVNQYNAVLSAVRNGTISRSAIRASAVRVIKWKINLGIISLK